jgi:hypothetical protein
MNRRDQALLAVGVVLALVLAFPLRNLVWDLLIVPLARIWWQFLLFYKAIPQEAYWFMLLFIFIYIAAGTFAGGKPKPEFEHVKRQQVQGEIEALAICLEQSKGGVYFRWRVARTLGEIASSLLEMRGNRSERIRKLKGPGWAPPPEVQTYLEAGLNESFASYPMDVKKTPFDIDTNEVIAYLENQLETYRDKRK